MHIKKKKNLFFQACFLSENPEIKKIQTSFELTSVFLKFR